MRIPLLAEVTLEGRLERPPPGVPRRGLAILCHAHPSYGGNLDEPMIKALSLACTRLGLTALRFNYRGIGESDGTATGGQVEHEDVVAADRFVREHGRGPVFWFGHSLGARLCLRAIGMGSRPDAFVGVATPTSFLDDDPRRLEFALAAVRSGVPSLYVSGTNDIISDVEMLASWAEGQPSVVVEALPGESHTLSTTATDLVIAHATAFVNDAML